MSMSNLIKSIQDIMRQDSGVDGDAQRISQLAWMIFLKIFDDREQEEEAIKENHRSPIPDNLKWRNWAANDEGMTGDELLNFIQNELFKTLKNLTLTPEDDVRGQIVRDIFADAYNYMKSGTLIRQVINKINQIDFTKQEDCHIFNEIYEQILRGLQSAGNAGEYYTPRAVTQFIVDMIAPKLGETILDPACGTGGFLICALEHLRRQAKNVSDQVTLQHSILGIEKKPLPYMLCVTNLILHGIETRQILRENSLSRPLISYEKKDRVDIIVTNPPFGGMEKDGIEQNFPAKYRTKETADLFLVLLMQRLKEGGRCGIVLPDGTLFGEGVKTRIKEDLLSNCNLHTIVRLPNGVFAPYTGIRTNLLFFTKGEPTKEIWYFEHPYPPGYKSYSKTQPIRIKEFDLEKAWWENRVENEYAWKVSAEVIRERGYNLDCKNPHEAAVTAINPDELLASYQKLLQEIAEKREKLRQALEICLKGGQK